MMKEIKNNPGLVSRTYALLAMAVLAFGLMAASAPEKDPVQLLQFIADNMIRGLKQNHATLKSNPQIVYNLADRYIIPYADLPIMSQRVVPPTVWNGATPAQREAFQKAFTKTLVRTYASALTAYKDQTIKFFPVRGGVAGKTNIEVSSEIDSQNGGSQPINVTYRLIQKNTVWRLIDLSVDGVDMLESFRAQFADILSRGNMEKLLQQMAAHNSK